MLGVFGKAKQLDFQWVLTFYTEKKNKSEEIIVGNQMDQGNSREFQL